MTNPSPRPVRVLVVGARGIPNVEGGAEKNAEALFPLLVERGYDVTLLGLSSFNCAPTYKGVKLVAVPEWRILNTDKLLYYVTALFTCIRHWPDLVHLQGLGAAIFLWAYKLLGRKVVVRYGSADYILPKWGLLGRLSFRFCEWQLRYADAVISVAPSLSRRLLDSGIERNVHLIPNALDLPAGSVSGGGSRDSDYVVSVGRVTAQKNVQKLLEAFALFGRDRSGIDLRIAGGTDDANYFAELEPLITDRTRFLGRLPRNEVPQLLIESRLFMNISLHEGNSNATLEAISHGCAIVLSDIPENRDMGLPDQIYVDPLNAALIAQRIAQALSEPASFVVDKSAFLSWTDVADQTAAVYRRIGAG